MSSDRSDAEGIGLHTDLWLCSCEAVMRWVSASLWLNEYNTEWTWDSRTNVRPQDLLNLNFSPSCVCLVAQSCLTICVKCSGAQSWLRPQIVTIKDFAEKICWFLLCWIQSHDNLFPKIIHKLIGFFSKKFFYPSLETCSPYSVW